MKALKKLVDQFKSEFPDLTTTDAIAFAIQYQKSTAMVDAINKSVEMLSSMVDRAASSRFDPRPGDL